MDFDGNTPIGIVGTGVMGRGIGEWLSECGLAVTVLGRSARSLEAAREGVQASRTLAVRRQRLTAEQAEAATALLRWTEKIADLAPCGIVIEAVSEVNEVKREVLGGVSSVIGEDALIATNTSSLCLSALAGAVLRPERFIGLHFMNPVPLVNFVEIVTAVATSDDALSVAKNFCQAIKRQSITVRDTPGFVVNRLLMSLINEAAKVVAAGIASPQDVDKAMRLALGHPMGPLSVADLIGLDIIEQELGTLADGLGERFRCTPLITELVKKNQLGRKTGRGIVACRRATME